VIVPANESKTSGAIEFHVPAFLYPYLAACLDVVRPRMLRDLTCNALWVSPKGGPLSYSAIWFVLTRHTKSASVSGSDSPGPAHRKAAPGMAGRRHWPA
jgi:hypothetical protein